MFLALAVWPARGGGGWGDYIALEDFRAGLDARKSLLSAPPGSLREAVNAHITPGGGELEKRKAFVGTALPTNSFGLEATDLGLVVFCLLTPYSAEHMRIWIIRTAAIGFIISFAASLLILQFGEKIPWLGALLKPEETKTTPADPQP